MSTDEKLVKVIATLTLHVARLPDPIGSDVDACIELLKEVREENGTG